jgi:hypothetical protein
MPNYYEILGIAPTATVGEIDAAYESRYNECRRLVTHHNAAVVNQANQTLQLLETIRRTLTNLDSRSVYDAGIGASNIVGGLADPEQFLHSSISTSSSPVAPPRPAMTPPIPQRTASATPTPSVSVQSGLWACPKCKMDNPAHTQFCFNCGTQLVRECPECKQMKSLVATGFCGQCGYKYEIAQRRNQIRSILPAKQQDAAVLNNNFQIVQSRRITPGCSRSMGLLMVLVGAAALAIYEIAPGYVTNLGLYSAYYQTLLPIGIALAVLGLFLVIISIIKVTSAKSKQKAEAAAIATMIETNQHEMSALEQEFAKLATNRSGA